MRDLPTLPPGQLHLLGIVLLCFLVVFVVPRLGLLKTWRDITVDTRTGHTVAKDLFKATAFYVGVSLCCFIAYADFNKGRPISPEPALFLLAYSLGAAGLKVYENYANRKTATDAGQPLTEPGYSPPIPMPQVPNPNVPPAPPTS
ncbi:hypothetical protein [Hymenobacter mucosus]|uniref:Uncharacterized protein n=1 Tax=Hymenobacter mucosus TaxID=1411120 RepID=A0A239ABV9_9BACT|nr:hypothetical protein [Hymenobacter mucosus]SNR92821.1 hypothetical protein SAMN06269173_111123 [Hymenobacter mucosus]